MLLQFELSSFPRPRLDLCCREVEGLVTEPLLLLPLIAFIFVGFLQRGLRQTVYGDSLPWAGKINPWTLCQLLCLNCIFVCEICLWWQ